jgi:hypothetical protein
MLWTRNPGTTTLQHPHALAYISLALDEPGDGAEVLIQACRLMATAAGGW